MTFEELRAWWFNNTWHDWLFLAPLLVAIAIAVAAALRMETVVARRKGREPAHCRFWRRYRAPVVQFTRRPRRPLARRSVHHS